MKTTTYILKGILGCMVCGMIATGCDLDVVPPANIASETFWQTEKDAWYNLNSIYSKTVPGVGAYTDCFSDDVYCQYNWESSGSVYVQNGLSALNDVGWNFESIRAVNVFLSQVDNCTMDEDLKKRYKAEARALRAWSYLSMTLDFGKVPIITDVLAYDAENVPRDEVSKVREFIMSELSAATADLPASYSGGYPNEKGRITKYAVIALQARAALYFGDYVTAESLAKEVMDNGGYSLFRVTSLSAEQQKEADEMDLYVDFDTYGIDKDKFVKGMYSFEALWFNENGMVDNPEFIMTRQYASTGSWDYQEMTRYTSMRPNQLGGWSSVTPTQNLVDAYWSADGKSKPSLPDKTTRADAYKQVKADLDAYTPPAGRPKFLAFVAEKIASKELTKYKYIEEFRNRDSRLYVSILMPFKSWYETNYGNDFAYEWIKGGNNESKTGFNFRKMLVLENDPGNNGQATGDYPCIRYAEILLIYAEARTYTTGYDGEVQAALNQLRDRCGMPEVPTSLSKDEAIEFIRNERRIELAAEGFRPYDLVRYETEYVKKYMDNVDLTMPDGELIITMKWDERMRLRPLPQTAIDVNPLLKDDQNPGY